jgi:hypothetical protein
MKLRQNACGEPNLLHDDVEEVLGADRADVLHDIQVAKLLHQLDFTLYTIMLIIVEHHQQAVACLNRCQLIVFNRFYRKSFQSDKIASINVKSLINHTKRSSSNLSTNLLRTQEIIAVNRSDASEQLT